MYSKPEDSKVCVCVCVLAKGDLRLTEATEGIHVPSVTRPYSAMSCEQSAAIFNQNPPIGRHKLSVL